jgi:cysteine/glycine-rich protein
VLSWPLPAAAKFRALETPGAPPPRPAPPPAPKPAPPPPPKRALPVLGGSPSCPRCGKAVYAAEKVLGPGGADWHRACLACAACKRGLAAGAWSEHKGEAYCKPCHDKAYGPKGVRGGGGGGIMHAN